MPTFTALKPASLSFKIKFEFKIFKCVSITKFIFKFLEINSSHSSRVCFLFIENTSGGCPPIKQLEKIPSFVPDRNNCIKINKLRFNPNFYDDIDIIIINNLMGWYTVNDLEKYIIFLKNIKKEKIVVIGNYLVLKKDILKTFTVRDAYLIDYDFKSNFKIQTKLLFDSELFELSKKYDFLYISFKNLCKNEGCKLFDDKGFPFTLDQFHLTHQFTQYASHKLGIRKKIIQFINN